MIANSPLRDSLSRRAYRDEHYEHSRREICLRSHRDAVLFGGKIRKELYKFKTPPGIIGNVMTYQHRGKQYVAVLSGVGGWAGIGLAAGLTNPTDGLGAVGGYMRP